MPTPEQMALEDGREPLAVRLERARRHLNNSNSADGLTELRSIQNTLTTRRERVNYSLKAATFDVEVLGLARKGAEDFAAGRFDLAEYQFWRCTQVYPYHPKFTFDYAASLHGQNKLIDCESFFRSALALGEPLERVRPLLQDVAKRRMEPYVETPKCRFDPNFVEPINAIASKRGDGWLYPDVESLRSLLEVLTGQRNASAQYVGKLLRSCRTFWDAFVFIIETPEFRSANLDLCYVVGAMPKIQVQGSQK